jgi:hypothetical protein
LKVILRGLTFHVSGGLQVPCGGLSRNGASGIVLPTGRRGGEGPRGLLHKHKNSV